MGRPLNFLRVGSSSGPVLLCLHGFLGCGEDWMPFADALLQLDPRPQILLPDLPGHGRSPLLPDCSTEEMARAVWELLDFLRVPRAALAGYSMGGRVALQAAAMQPQRCAALLGISTGPGIRCPKERATRAGADIALANRMRGISDPEQWRKFLHSWWGQEIFQSVHWTPERVGELARKRAKQDPRALARVLEEASPGRMPDLSKHLSSFPFPCLFLAGGKDRKYAALAREMALACPRATREILHGHGHSLLVESPHACARIAARFLTSTQRNN